MLLKGEGRSGVHKVIDFESVGPWFKYTDLAKSSSFNTFADLVLDRPLQHTQQKIKASCNVKCIFVLKKSLSLVL